MNENENNNVNPIPEPHTAPIPPQADPLSTNPFQSAPQQPSPTPVYQPVYYPNNQYAPNPNMPKRHNGIGAASMIIGICSFFVCCCFCMFNSILFTIFGALIYLTGLILGIVATAKDRQKGLTNGMAIAGIILCSISLFLCAMILISQFSGTFYSDVTFFNYL